MGSPASGQAFHFVRCVPNIAVSICSGVCVLGVEQGCLETPSVGLLTSLFALLGYSKVLPESLMDSVTACSGSGIAYVSVCTQMYQRKLSEEIKIHSTYVCVNVFTCLCTMLDVCGATSHG